MLNLGTVLPGSTIEIPVNTFDSNDPSASVTATNWANTDCHIHKDAGTTQRASSAGETLSIDFDTVTGNHMLTIDLSDNTTANFYEAGSRYSVRIEGVTVDAGTINAWIATFRIGYPGAILDTTIATLSSQTSFTLEDGSTDDDAYNGFGVIVHDLASAVQIAHGIVSDYTGSTKTITLKADPGIFTMAAGDNISLFRPVLTATTPGSTLDVTSTGAAGIDWGNVENKTTANDLSATDIQLCDTVTTLTGHTAQTADHTGTLTTIDGKIDAIDIIVDEILLADKSVTSAVNDPGAAATTTVFNTDLTAVDDFYNDMLLVFTSGSLAGQSKPIADYANTNGQITLDEALTAAPADNDTFYIKVSHIHPTTQIADAILDRDASSSTTNSTLGAIINDWEDGGRLDLLIDAASTHSAADVWTAATRTLTAATNITSDGAAINTTSGAIDTVTTTTTATNVTTVNALATAAITDVWSTDTLTESYAADGAAGTPAQMLYMIQQHLTEFAISGTTWTTKKLDGSTTAATFTLDDGSNPTSITRAT